MKKILCLGSLLVISQCALGQPPEAAQPRPQGQQRDVNYAIGAGAAYQFDTDIKGDRYNNSPADFSMAQYSASVGVSYPITGTPVQVAHSLVYEYDDYHFSSGGVFVDDFGPNLPAFRVIGEPWSDTHLVSYTAKLTYKLNPDWSIFGGPILGLAGESGADIGKSFTYGGMLGASYSVSNNLVIGAGAIAIKEIEEDTRLLPLLIFEYQVSDSFTVRNSRPLPGIRGTTGVEANWSFAPKWSAGLGFAYDRRRFRLEENGDYPNFVAQNTSFPVYARLEYQPTDSWSLALVGGMLFGGELRLENADGRKVGQSDYENAPFIGATAMYRF